MSLDRKQRLAVLRESRTATRLLGELVRKTDCTAEAVEALLERGAVVEEATTDEADPYARHNVRKLPAIGFVLARDQHDVAKLLWQAGGLERGYRQSWMEKAIHSGANASLRVFIELGGTQTIKETQQAELLTAAAVHGNVDALGWLLDAGLSANCRTHDETSMGVTSETPLHRASNARCAEKLLAAGADPNAPDQRGFPPLYMILSMAGTKSRERAEDRRDQAHDQANDLMAAAAALIRAGAHIEATIDNGYRWSVIDGLNELRMECTDLIQALRPRLNTDAVKGRIKSPHLAIALLDVMPDLDPKDLIQGHAWRSIRLDDPLQIEAVETLLLRGLTPPKIRQLDEHRWNEWLGLGIPVTAQEVEALSEELDDDGNLLHRPLDPVAVAESNAKALARVAKMANASITPSGRLKM